MTFLKFFENEIKLNAIYSKPSFCVNFQGFYKDYGRLKKEGKPCRKTFISTLPIFCQSK